MFRTFGQKTSAKEVVDTLAPNKGLAGKVAVVTGGNSGIGLETVKALAYGGARVIMASRDPDRGREALDKEVKAPGLSGYAIPYADVVVKRLDLSDLGSVAEFAKDVASSEPRLDFIICNAGVMALPTLMRTSDAFEMQIGVNHYGHALLMRLLLPKLEAQEHSSRIVILGSAVHNIIRQLDTTDLNFRSDESVYRRWSAYGRAKLANILFCRALAKRLPTDSKVNTVCVHPGIIATKLYRSTIARYPPFGWIIHKFIADKDVSQGASTTVWACLSEEAGQKENAGRYCVDCALSTPSSLARDDQAAEDVWNNTEEELNEALAKRGLDPMGNKLAHEPQTS